jgi:hypothetical protein
LTDQQHIIRRQIIEVQAPTKEKALNLQGTVSDLVQTKVNKAIEEILNRISATDELIEIDTLELDLGKIKSDVLSFELPKKTKEKLEDILIKEVHRAREASTSSSNNQSTETPYTGSSNEKSNVRIKQLKQSQIEQLSHFLQTGALSWQAKSGDKESDSIETILVELISSQPDLIKATLLELLSDETVIQRFIYQFKLPVIEKVFHLIAPKFVDKIIRVNNDLVSIQLQKNIVPKSTESFKQDLLKSGLSYLVNLSTNSSKSSLASDVILQDYFQSTLGKFTGVSKSAKELEALFIKIRAALLFNQEKGIAYKTSDFEAIVNNVILSSTILKTESKKRIFKKDYDRLVKNITQSGTKKQNALDESFQSFFEEINMHLEGSNVDNAEDGSGITVIQKRVKQLAINFSSNLLWELKSNKLTEKKLHSLFSKLRQVFEKQSLSKKQHLIKLINTCEAEFNSQLKNEAKIDDSKIQNRLNNIYFEVLKVIAEIQQPAVPVSIELIDAKIISIEEQLAVFEKQGQFANEVTESNLLLAQIKQLLQFGKDESRLKVARKKLSDIEDILNITTAKSSDNLDKDAGNKYTIDPDFFKKPEKEIVIDAYIENAGLVLVANFLTPLFKNLGLVEGQDFVTDESRHRAVHVAQYLITGETTTPEHELILNKILCGMEPEDPVPLNIELSDAEKAECKIVLEAVIANWTVLGNASIESVRDKFLVREGILFKEGKKWNVNVERGSFDMLLDKINWSYSMIKMPWNEEFIYVKW